ncbi:hypothetical protein E4T43_02219 [Aureobasidium subglaciale]|nr:hypothetical protein E4T43_02219 [Aureobasidium subglaciale]
MNSFRVARAALRVRPTAFAAPLARRGYADVAADKIQLSLALPHQAIYKSQDVVQVNIPAETGDMGVLASHVPSIEQLRPGLVEVIEESAGSKQFFLSGGFATVQPGSKLSINAVEGYPLEDFSPEAVRNQIAEAQKIASGNGSETDIAEAKIELERRPHAPEVAARFGQPGRVADRIRAINSLQQLPSIKAKKPKEPDPPLVVPINPPSADELHRASPFPRRDSAQSPIRPDTPFSQSQPLVSPLVHCPMPKRYQPQLSANIEKGAIPTINFDQSMCYRHGRKLQSIKSVPAGMNKTFSGAYIPIGLMIRQQVDPLSPWSVGARLAKTSGTTVSPDICPDCFAEKNILKRETEITMRTPQVQPNHHVRSASSSIFTERGTPPDSTQSSNALIGTTIDNQTIKIPGATISDLPPDKFGGIVATDLGDLIDAIIVEHSGSLGKVISNIRNGMPDSDWTQKLSRDLAEVSEAVASLPKDNIKNAPAFSQNINGRRSIILDASPDTLRKRAKTMPELLDLIDVATEELGTTGSDNRQQDLNLDRPHMPGGFPLSRSTFPSTAPHTPVFIRAIRGICLTISIAPNIRTGYEL